MRIFCRLAAAVILVATATILAGDAPNPKVQKEYDALLKQADVACHPERHR